MAIFLSKYYGRIPLIILWQLIVGLSPAIQAREVAAPILTWADLFFKSKSKDCLCKPPPLPPLQQQEGQSLHPGAQTPIIQCCSINYVAIDVFKGNLSFKTLSYQTERAMKMFMMSNLCSGAWRSLSLSHCWSRLRPRYKSLTSQDTLKQSVVKNLEILFTDWGSDTLKQSVVKGVTGWRNLWSWLERRHLPHDSLTGLSKQPLIVGFLLLSQWQILFWKLLLWIIFCRYCPSGQLFCKLLSWTTGLQIVNHC